MNKFFRPKFFRPMGQTPSLPFWQAPSTVLKVFLKLDTRKCGKSWLIGKHYFCSN